LLASRARWLALTAQSAQQDVRVRGGRR
jgi:hypothetical protein